MVTDMTENMNNECYANVLIDNHKVYLMAI